MIDPAVLFEERVKEINEYLEFTKIIEQATRSGVPKIEGASITGIQQKIIYATVYLQLYSLVESTANSCLDAITSAISGPNPWKPSHLSESMRKEWLRSVARTHRPMDGDARLEATLKLYGRLVEPHPPVGKWSIERGGGGNWDDVEIGKIAKRVDCDLLLPAEMESEIKRIVRDDKGTLALIRHLRNQLAHGEISFSECGENVTVSHLHELKSRVEKYLRVVVSAFKAFIDSHKFIDEPVRPDQGGEK